MAPRRGLSEEEEHIHQLLEQMGSATDRAIQDALSCFHSQDTILAREIISRDAKINALQHQVEEACLATIARQQPVARDLRDLLANTFIASDLERIADHAADIAGIVLLMKAAPAGDCAEAMITLGNKCRDMLKRIMLAHSECNEQLARQVAAEDDEVDAEEQRIISGVLEHMAQAADHLAGTHVLWAVHNVERIGDHITNIAERIVFMETGVNPDLNRS